MPWVSLDEDARAARRRGYLAIAVTLSAAAVCRAYGGHAAGDDTFIYMRYVQNELDQRGLTFNPGEPSFGVTSPLWTFLMTIIAGLRGNSLEVWRVTSSLLFGGAVGVVFAFANARASLGWATTAAAVVMLEPHTLRWASAGMENGLTAFLVALALTSSLGKPETRSGNLGTACGLLPFARPELTLLAGALLLWRRDSKAIAIAAVLAALILLQTYGAFGAVVPQTATAKALALKQSSMLYAPKQVAAVLLSGAGGAMAAMLLAPRRGSANMLAKIVVACTAVVVVYLAVVNQLVSTRYATHLCFPLVVTAALLLTRESTFRADRALAAQAVIAIAVLVYTWPATRVSETADIRAFAQAARELTPKDARIAMTEVGMFGFHSGRHIVDLIGLTDREALAHLKAHGKPDSTRAFEDALIALRATHYVTTHGHTPDGERLRFDELLTGTVRRNNLSRGRVVESTWRLFRLSKRQQSEQTGRDQLTHTDRAAR